MICCCVVPPPIDCRITQPSSIKIEYHVQTVGINSLIAAFVDCTIRSRSHASIAVSITPIIVCLLWCLIVVCPAEWFPCQWCWNCYFTIFISCQHTNNLDSKATPPPPPQRFRPRLIPDRHIGCPPLFVLSVCLPIDQEWADQIIMRRQCTAIERGGLSP